MTDQLTINIWTPRRDGVIERRAGCVLQQGMESLALPNVVATGKNSGSFALMATVKILNYIAEDSPQKELEERETRILCNSSYVVNGFNLWLPSWKQRGWLTKQDEPVKQRRLWEDLVDVIQMLGAELSLGDTGRDLGMLKAKESTQCDNAMPMLSTVGWPAHHASAPALAACEGLW